MMSERAEVGTAGGGPVAQLGGEGPMKLTLGFEPCEAGPEVGPAPALIVVSTRQRLEGATMLVGDIGGHGGASRM